MSIVSFKHIATTTLFAQTKFSASANNASYYQGDNTELLYFGAPDIMYEDVCFCKEKGVIYTHGAFYNSGANKGGNFVPQVKNMDSYLAEDGEIVEYVGQTDENYTNGYFYKFRSGIEYKSITIPANKKIVTIYHPDGTQEIGYEIDEELSINSAAWRTSNISSIEPINGGILTNSADWYPYFNSEIAKVGDKIWVKNGNEYIWGEIVGWFWYINLYNYSTSSESINRQIPQSIAESTSKEEATSKILQWLTENGYPQPTIYIVDNIKVKVLLDNGESYYLSSNGAGGYSSINAVTLISPDGKKIFVRTDNVSEQNIYKSTEIRKKGSEYHWYIDPNYNYPTYYTVDTLSESITLKVPVLYEEDGSLKNINSQNLEPSTWQRIDVQPTPNDVVMCKMSDGIVYDSYITYTKIKQYLPDYPYYSDNLNWEIGGNPPMRASITEGDYYLDVDTNHIFVADENIELVDVTSSVVIQGDTNKLYCDTNTNQLYRYDGSNFVALTSNFSGDYNDLINKPDLNFLKQRNLTTYQGENDEIVQHIGSNSSGYINGYVYKKSYVHSLTYNGVTYTRVGETDDNVTWELYKITQDDIDYVMPKGVNIGDNFWVVRGFTTLEVVHIFEIDNIGENEERTLMDVEGHFLGTNITLHFVAPYSEIIYTSKALIYKNGNNYLYCDSTFRFFASSVNNNNANVIPFDGTVNNAYAWQRVNVQPQQLSLENSKVKYTLSDGITKLTLAQESDLNFKDNIGGLNLLQNSGTLLGKWVTNVNSPIYNASEVTPSGTYQGNRYINVTMAWKGVSMPINCKGSTTYTHSVFLRTNNDTWVIGYVAEFDGTVWSSTLLTNAIQLTTSFKRYSLTYTTKATTQQVMFIFECTSNGSVDFCMLKTEEGSVATDWSPNPQDFRNTPVEFTSAAVSGNIASGETLAVMFKKINIALGKVNIGNSDWTFTEYIRDYNLYGVFYKTLGILMICGWFRVVATDIPRYAKLFKLKGYSGYSCYPMFATEDLTNGERHTLRTKLGEAGYDGYFLFVNRTSTSNSIYFEGLPTIMYMYED